MSLQTPPPQIDRKQRWITPRAVIVGTLLTAGTATLTPWNDYVVFNTLTTGGFFPPAVALSLFVLVLLINAPLHALAPRFAFRTPELAIILGMLLIGCAVPGQGLMRGLLPGMVSPFHFQRSEPAFAAAWQNADVPSWLFPVDPAQGHADRVVTEFYGRTPDDATPPYTAWIRPILIWGVFVAGVYMALLSMASLLRQQWAHNERLAFPVAQLESALIAAPGPGHWVNELLRARSFWIALGTVFLIHTINGLATYFPRYVPPIWLSYDLNRVMTKEPWTYLNGSIKVATVYFTVVGVMYFIPGRIGFSLWAVWFGIQIMSWTGQTTFGTPIAGGALNDQHFGAALAFVAGVAWIGRKHWATVTRHVFFGPAPGEDFSYRGPALTLGAGILIMWGWLLVVGVTAWLAAVYVGMALLAHLVVARVVAETGLPIFRTTLNPFVITSNLSAASLTGRDVYFAGVTGITGGAFNTRETALGLSLHAHRVLDDVDPAPPRSARRGLVALMVWSILVAFVCSAASGLYCYYNHSTPISTRVAQPVINDHLLLVLPRSDMVDPMTQHAQGAFAAKGHDAYFHMGVGAAVMTALQLLSWASANWPIAPIGYLTATTWYTQMIWFSVFLGWLAKALLVRFGGAPLYRTARPFFVGLVFGECLAATLWLLVSITMALTGNDYFQIRLLPT